MALNDATFAETGIAIHSAWRTLRQFHSADPHPPRSTNTFALLRCTCRRSAASDEKILSRNAGDAAALSNLREGFATARQRSYPLRSSSLKNRKLRGPNSIILASRGHGNEVGR